MKFERGWGPADDDILDELDLSSLTLTEKEELGLARPKEDVRMPGMHEHEVDYGPQPDVGESVKKRLDMLETFYVRSAARRNTSPLVKLLIVV